MKKIYIAVLNALFLILSPCIVYAQAGGTGHQLQINPDARSCGMGETGVATSWNSSSLFWNPALLAKVEYAEFYLTYHSLWGMADYGYIGMTIPKFSSTYSLGYSQIYSGEIDRRDIFNHSIGQFSEAYRVVHYGLGSQLYNFLALGFSVKGINHVFAGDIRNAFTLSGGIIITPVSGLHIGYSEMNLWGREYFGHEETEPFSSTRRVGLAYQYDKIPLNFAMDYEWSPYYDKTMHLGLEYSFWKKLFLRIGHYSGANTIGMGLSLGHLKMDFGFVEHPMGDRGKFTLIHEFGESIFKRKREKQDRLSESKNQFQLGIKLYDDNHYEKALEHFNVAFELNPKNKEYGSQIKKTSDLINNYKRAQEAVSLNHFIQAINILKTVLQSEKNFKKADSLLVEVEKKYELRVEAEKFYQNGLEFEKQDRISDAIELWQKTIGIDANHPGALSKLEHYEQLEPLKCEVSVIEDIYAAIYKYYAIHSFGTLLIKNKGKTAINDVKVQIMIQNYLDFPTIIKNISFVPPESEIQVPVTAVFNNRVLSLTEDTNVGAELTVMYEFHKSPIERHITTSFMIYNRNIIKWDDPQKVAAFIMPKDPVVRYFSNNVLQQIDYQWFGSIPKNVVRAMAIFDALALNGIQYIPDPNNPYAKISQDRNAIDLVWYPRETLQQLSGDCDDLAVLYCSLLEAIGINTRIIDVPGHLFMAFDTGVKKGQSHLISPNEEDYLVFDDIIWIPVETTQIANGFFNAWRTGINIIGQSK